MIDDAGMRNHPAITRLIPVTELRHFYRTLRRFGSKSFHRQAAMECLRRPDQLAEMVRSSHRHFAYYDNHLEGFHSRTTRGAVTALRRANRQLANLFVNEVATNSVTVNSAPGLNFSFVDFEISPIRTKKSEFETGDPGRRGRGGLDLLLANRDDQLPIVGEVKADTDRNPFLGLIQSLTYAVELSTVPQRDRLARHYPGRFTLLDSGPWVDIYLFLLRYPADDDSQRFLTLTDQIAEQIVSADSPVASIVRRIVGLHCPMMPDGPQDCTIAFSHGR